MTHKSSPRSVCNPSATDCLMHVSSIYKLTPNCNERKRCNLYIHSNGWNCHQSVRNLHTSPTWLAGRVWEDTLTKPSLNHLHWGHVNLINFVHVMSPRKISKTDTWLQLANRPNKSAECTRKEDIPCLGMKKRNMRNDGSLQVRETWVGKQMKVRFKYNILATASHT